MHLQNQGGRRRESEEPGDSSVVEENTVLLFLMPDWSWGGVHYGCGGDEREVGANSEEVK